MNTKPDPEQFARAILFQLASLRAESVQTHRAVLEILEHQNNGTMAGYQKLVTDRELTIQKERDRIYLEMLRLANISAHPPGDASK